MTGKASSQRLFLADHREMAMLDMLREARAIVHRNAESFSEAAAILEHVGEMLSGLVLILGVNHCDEWDQA
jgi:hypothetical protein